MSSSSEPEQPARPASASSELEQPARPLSAASEPEQPAHPVSAALEPEQPARPAAESETWRARRWVVPAAHELLDRHGRASAEALDPQRLRVLVWNVYKGRRRSFGPRFRSLASDRDLILAQELYFGPTTHALLGELALEWVTATSFHYARRDHVGTGLGTAARAASLGARALVTHGREALTRTPKLALLTEHALGGERLLVANVHAINFSGYASFDAQLGRIEAALAEHRGPLLVAGDFNTWSRRRRRRLEQLGSQASLEPVCFRNDRRTSPLDHALIRGLVVDDARVEPSRASDHAALCLELGLDKVVPDKHK